VLRGLRVGRWTSAMLAIALLSTAGAVAPAVSVGSEPSPQPILQPQPTPQQEDPQVGPGHSGTVPNAAPDGSVTTSDPPPNCDGGAPLGLMPGPHADLSATVLYADAGVTSNLLVDDESGHRDLLVNATNKVADTVSVGSYPVAVGLGIGIYTPAWQSYRWSHTDAKVVQPVPGVWIVCFEDGTDGDYNDLIVSVFDVSCRSETQRELGEASDQVRVRYQPRHMWEPSDPNFLAKADLMAEAIRDRAVVALARFSTLHSAFDAGDDIPAHIDIVVDCALPLGANNPGIVLDDTITLRAADFKRWMTPYVTDSTSVAEIGTTDWANAIDHEVYHTVQYKVLKGLLGFGIRYVSGDYSNLESSAVVAQDLFAERDDFVPEQVEQNDPSFVRFVRNFLSDRLPVVTSESGPANYMAAAFLQYLGERFGTLPAANLELRVAQFLRSLWSGDTGIAGIATAIGSNDPNDALRSLRDFYIALYSRSAANATDLAREFRILDETTQHGQPANYSAALPALSWGVLTTEPVDQFPFSAPYHLRAGGARVLEASVPPSTTMLRVTITDNTLVHTFPFFLSAPAAPTDAVHLGFVPKLRTTGTEQVFVDVSSVQVGGPPPGQSKTYEIPVNGASHLGVVIVAGNIGSFIDVNIEEVTGQASLSVKPISATYPGDAVIVRLQPAIGGIPVRLQQPRDSFSVTIDGQPAEVTWSYDLGVDHMLVVHAQEPLSVGSHEVSIGYLDADAVVRSFEVISRDDLSVNSFAPVPAIVAVESITHGGGAPMEIRAVLLDEAQGLTGATVTVEVADPQGTVRRAKLSDRGDAYDSAPEDGNYGSALYGTTISGLYTVTVRAVGEGSLGNPFDVVSTTSTLVEPMVDTDGDGVPDALEAQYGLDPNEPGDGSTDLDGDGLGTAQELILGTNPLHADTDGGGEADGSEIIAELDPLNADDDRNLPQVFLTAVPRDGRFVDVAVVARDGSTSVRVFRVGNDATVDLGTFSGSGDDLTDGPLPAGNYRYYGVAESAQGARTARYTTGVIEVAEDVTAPTARLVANRGAGLINTLVVELQLLNISEPVTHMRVAGSLEGLSAAAWEPFSATTSFTLTGADGVKVIYGQLRDAHGNVSEPMANTVRLDREPPMSEAGPLPPFTVSPNLFVPYTATDDTSIASVELWVRSRATSSGTWSNWTRSTTNSSSPIYYHLHAQGFYEFATIARDRAGNREATVPQTADVSIRYGPEQISDDPGTARQLDQRIVTGRDGNVYAIWVDERNSATVDDAYFASRNSVTTNWSANERVDNSPSEVSNPALAVDASGNAHALWVDARNGDRDIWYSTRSAATGVWSASVRVNNDGPGAIQDQPAIAVSATGEVLALWVDGRSNGSAIYFARRPAGATQWSANYRVSSDTKLHKASPDIAVGGNGIAYGVWDQSKNGVSSVRFATLPVGATSWTGETQVSHTSTLSMNNAKIAVDGTGRLIVTYQRGIVALWARTRPSGGTTWSTQVALSTTTNALSSSLAMRSNGVAYASWKDLSGQVYGVRYNSATQTWGSQEHLLGAGERHTVSMTLTDAEALIAASDYVSNNYDIRGYVRAVP
jgi:hypothetical protein